MSVALIFLEIAMSGHFKDYVPEQSYLLPPSLREWLPEDHLAYFVSDVVDQLDLSEIVRSYTGETRGQPAYNPWMMTKLLFYAYCIGEPSSRRIERKTYEDVAFRVLCANQHPDHDTISEFRKRHKGALQTLFVQVLKLCEKAGLVKLGHVALDGTKVKANASKHKAMSYARMCEKEKHMEEEVQKLMAAAEAADAEEDARYGQGKRGDELSEELKFRQKRLKRLREAKAALEREAQEQARQQQQRAKLEEAAAEEGQTVPAKAPKISDTPDPKAQRNFTDPESRIMKDAATNGFVQAYNAQVAVDAQSQVIVAAEVTQEANDKQQVQPMVEQIEENLGRLPKELSTDSGYYSERNVWYVAGRGIEPLMCPDRLRHGEGPGAARGRIPKDATVTERMRRKLQTKSGRRRYCKRKGTVEPVIGQIKEIRGFRQFLRRGLENVRGEWKLICLTHNLLKLHRAGGKPWLS